MVAYPNTIALIVTEISQALLALAAIVLAAATESFA